MTLQFSLSTAVDCSHWILTAAVAQQQLWRAMDSKFCPLLLEVVKGVDDEVDITLLKIFTIFDVDVYCTSLHSKGACAGPGLVKAADQDPKIPWQGQQDP